MLHTLLLVPSIFAGLVMVFLMALAVHLVNDGKILAQTRTENGVSIREGTFLKEVGLKGWVYAFVVGVIYWFTIYFGPTFTTALWVSPILYCLMLAFIAGLVIWWLRKAYGVGEFICFTLMALAFTLAAKSEGYLFALLCGGSAFIVSLFAIIPWMFFVAAVGSFLIDACRHYRNDECEKDGKEYKIAYWVECILIAVFTVALILMLIFGIKWNALSTKTSNEPAPVKTTTETAKPATTPKETAKPVETPAETAKPVETAAPEELVLVEDEGGEFVLSSNDWYELRHLAVLGGEKEDDDDFGKNPLDEILAKKVAEGKLTVKDISGKTEKQLYDLVTVEEIFDKFVDELAKDPIKGAADMGYYDVIHGTNFLGAFSTELKDHPDALMERINAKALEWLQDEDEYRKVLTAFVATLQRSDEIEISYASNGLDDQMYMFGTTPDHVPIVIVMESTNHAGYLLTFRDYIKGTTEITVKYRINCDFQPTNVSKVANVTVKPNPANPPSTGGGGGGSTGGGGTPSTGGGAAPSTGGGGTTGGGGYTPPDPPITNPKDPTKGTPVGENKGKGPGPNTNNGVGATWSTEEEPTNSLHEELGDYWEDIAELKEPQKEAGDPNAPTYTPPPAADPPKVDNNGNKGTGNGGADQPTPVAPEVTYTDPDDGKTKSFNDEGAGDEWEIGA